MHRSPTLRAVLWQVAKPYGVPFPKPVKGGLDTLLALVGRIAV